jgi:hypothetical protein
VKRISALTTFLAALLFITYYYEEVPQRRDDLKKTEGQPFSFLQMEGIKKENLLSIKIGHLFIEKKKNGFFLSTPTGPLPVDSAALEGIFEKLSQVRLERILLSQERQGLTKEYFFKVPSDKITF